jgi:ribosomal protein S18 acetylase RimI-like enzyme
LHNPAPEAGYALKADAWLAAHLGKPSWRVELAQDQGQPLTSLAREPGFAYAKVAAADLPCLQHLLARGFYPVDVAVTFEGPSPAGAFGADVRFAVPEDRDAVARIAGTTFKYSRFHLDPAIPRATADRIKAEWAANFFSGRRGDAMVVAQLAGRVVGFLQLLRPAADVLVIDLVGVSGDCQGRGLARQMIAFAAAHGLGDGRAPARMRVGTQIANTRSVRLYESLGLRLVDAQYVLHYHGSERGMSHADR